ncbi:UPF0175 family protein [Chlorogloeopsis sp. ULAP01]|uniref:UPF0175 family protein n=1 Tax=Chlorogloeopsis sp. ULAP01 TaxID=3056483 RepID=UPI003014C042
MSIVIPDDIVRATKMSEDELKLEIAIMLFEQEKITLGTASQFAGINQLEFQRVLASRKIPIHYSVKEFQQDLKTLEANHPELEQVQPTQTEILQRIEQRRTFSPAQHNLPDSLILLQEDRAR